MTTLTYLVNMDQRELKFKQLFPSLKWEDFKLSTIWECCDIVVEPVESQVLEDISETESIPFNDKPGPVG